MSECKKTCGNCAGRIESILSKDRCDMTRNTIENYSNTCNHWEPNRETKVVMQKDELKALRKERDELQAQVAVLRGALETATDYLYNPFEPDNQCAQYKNIKNILQTTPAEAAERVQKLVEALESTADDIGIEVNNLQDVHNGIVQSAVHHLRDVASGIDKALAEWNKP